MSDELPPEFLEEVTQPWVTQEVGGRRRRRRSRTPWLVCCVVVIVLLAVLLYLFSGPVTPYRNCPELASDSVVSNSTGTLSAQGNAPTLFSIRDYEVSGCSSPAVHISGWVGFSACGSGACRGDLTIYTYAQWESSGPGNASGYVWCYPETAADAGSGPCSAYSGGGFSFAGFPAPEPFNGTSEDGLSYVLVLTSAGLSESYALTLTTFEDWTPPAP